ncbi:hypothetical protein ANCDUO_18327, partial [Ancylostoma duodenale]
ISVSTVHISGPSCFAPQTHELRCQNPVFISHITGLYGLLGFHDVRLPLLASPLRVSCPLRTYLARTINFGSCNPQPPLRGLQNRHALFQMGKYDKYFSECEGNFICKECDWITRKKEDSSTCSFRHHLKTKHPNLFKELQESDKELKENVKEKIKNKERSLKRSLKVVQLEEGSAPKTSRKEEDTPSIVQVFKEYEPDGVRTMKIERAILQFICTATLPLSIVENRGFQNLMSILCPRFKIKSRTHYTRNSLVDLYNEYWTKVDGMLSAASHISFACDTWTSADNNHSILGLTAHFITKDMVPKFIVAAATPIKTRHTAENTKALLAKVLGTFNIEEEKIHMFVRDAATSMVATTNLLNMKSWDCFAHKIQLAVKDGLKILDSFESGSNSLIARLTSIVRKMKKSGVDKESFKEYQTLCSVPNRVLLK